MSVYTASQIISMVTVLAADQRGPLRSSKVYLIASLPPYDGGLISLDEGLEVPGDIDFERDFCGS